MRELEGIMAYDHSDQVMNEYDSLTNRFNEKDGFSYPSRIVGVLIKGSKTSKAHS